MSCNTPPSRLRGKSKSRPGRPRLLLLNLFYHFSYQKFREIAAEEIEREERKLKDERFAAIVGLLLSFPSSFPLLWWCGQGTMTYYLGTYFQFLDINLASYTIPLTFIMLAHITLFLCIILWFLRKFGIFFGSIFFTPPPLARVLLILFLSFFLRFQAIQFVISPFFFLTPLFTPFLGSRRWRVRWGLSSKHPSFSMVIVALILCTFPLAFFGLRYPFKVFIQNQ